MSGGREPRLLVHTRPRPLPGPVQAFDPANFAALSLKRAEKQTGKKKKSGEERCITPGGGVKQAATEAGLSRQKTPSGQVELP